MGFGFVYDGPPSKCAKGARPGTKALRDGTMHLFPGVTDLGIFNCRPTRNSGSSTLSFHADGRAWDPGCSGDLNEQVFQFFIAHADDLGIQEAISKRRRWDSRTREIKHYGGDDPHTEHVHVSQCIRAANSLTVATVLGLGASQEDDLDPERLKTFDQMAYAVLQLLLPATGRIELAVSDDTPLDPAKVAELVIAGLDPKAIASAVVSAMPKDQAAKVADELAKRLKD